MDTTQLTPGREYFLQPLTTREQAEQFILRLEREDLSFHFDDSPTEIIRFGSGERVFTDAEAAALRTRVAELFALLDDPFELPAACTNAEGGRVYRIDWIRGYGDSDGKWGYYAATDLTEDIGFTADDLQTLEPLQVGGSIPMAGPTDLATVTRLQ